MKPLNGIKILDLSWVYSGPYGTLLLSDLGAEVIKVERPPFGDWTRIVPPLKNNWSGYFYMLNRGKESIALDFKSEKGRALFFDLIKEVDVVAENFTAGTLDKLGIGYEEAKKVNPRIIYASVNGFGSEGPYSSKKCVDPVAQAMGGLMSLTGFPGSPPVKTGPAVADALAGMNMAIGILSAIIMRDREGRGSRIDISMMDSVFAVLEESVIRTSLTGNPLPARGNTDPLGAPWDAFQTNDHKWIMVCAIGSDAFVKIYDSIGRHDLATEYAGDDEEAFEKRSLMLSYLNSEFARWAETKKADEIMDFFEALGVPCGLVKNVEELLDDPQLLSRNMVVDIEHPILGRIKTFNNPVVFLDVPSQVQPGENQLDPKVGEHTNVVLKRLLKISDADLEQLKKDEVIWI